MKQPWEKPIKKIVHTLIFMLCISGIITGKVMAENITDFAGVFTRAAPEQQQLTIKPHSGAGEISLQWNEKSVFLVNRQPVSAQIFIEKAKGKRVEILAASDPKQKTLAIIQKCSYEQTTY